ncbi:hypothetical protein AVEN_32230-1 [Araneus ventricosus]|uniref:Uncharacterized protein n=1 Tax=Araneus ventricosus TaxID=182803 RepID=A0A4Y2W677_ARAVE|nr:hypothetical protein AVEN_32230-1 [Araneus ventricosus]
MRQSNTESLQQSASLFLLLQSFKSQSFLNRKKMLRWDRKPISNVDLIPLRKDLILPSLKWMMEDMHLFRLCLISIYAESSFFPASLLTMRSWEMSLILRYAAEQQITMFSGRVLLRRSDVK